MYVALKKNAVFDSDLRAVKATGVFLTKKGFVERKILCGLLSAVTPALEREVLFKTAKKTAGVFSEGFKFGDDPREIYHPLWQQAHFKPADSSSNNDGAATCKVLHR